MASNGPVQTEQPKQTSFGEIAVPAAFQLARQLKKAPKAIAAELSTAVGHDRGRRGDRDRRQRLSERPARPRVRTALALLSRRGSGDRRRQREKTIVEHTNINPNKAAHIGHLRNAILGDTFVRMLRATGRNVEVQNYIDNTGVQVADVVVGFRASGKEVARRVRTLIETTRFDYLCWDLYARMSPYYAEHPEALEWRTRRCTRSKRAKARRRSWRTWWPTRSSTRASGDHVAAEYRVRRAAARERDSPPASSGPRRSSC